MSLIASCAVWLMLASQQLVLETCACGTSTFLLACPVYVSFGVYDLQLLTQLPVLDHARCTIYSGGNYFSLASKCVRSPQKGKGRVSPSSGSAGMIIWGWGRVMLVFLVSMYYCKPKRVPLRQNAKRGAENA